jgi:ketosteroid isomerase-like protein
MIWFKTVWLAVIVMISGCFALPAWSHAQDEKAAATQTLNDYYRAFSKAVGTLDPQGVLAYYHEPVMFITTQNVIVAATRSEAAARVSGFFESLRAQGYGHSELADLRIKQVSAGLIVASGVRVQYKADGQELGRTAVTSVLRKTNEGWKIAILMGQDPGTALRLD